MKLKLLFVVASYLIGLQCMAQLPSYLPASGLVAWYPFNGNANDESGNNYNATITGGIFIDDRNGNPSGAIQFTSAAAGYIDANIGNNYTQDFTVSIWVRADRTSTYVNESSVCPGGVSVPMANSNQNWAFIPPNFGTNLGAGLAVNQNGIIVAEHANNILVSRLSHANSSTGFNHVVMVYRSDSTFLYVDGSLVRSRAIYCISNSKNLGSNLRFGGALYSPNFAGAIDEVGIWSRALSRQEVSNLYQDLNTPPDLCQDVSQIVQTDTSICLGNSITLDAVNQTGNFTIGSAGPAGGIIFYDQGSTLNGWRYLEAAPSDIQQSSWGCPDFSVSGTSIAIGAGLTNTMNIVNQCSQTNTAAYYCLNHSVNNFDDWFLPSQGEFALMYQNLVVNGIGNFASEPLPAMGTLYWTSTQLTPASGSHCCFECGGNFYQYAKVYNLYVRPIRRFTAEPVTYLWSNGATTASISVSPEVTTTYTLSVTQGGQTCTSEVTVTVNQPSASTIEATIIEGETYDFNGLMLNTEGTYVDTFQTVAGCDSIITLNLIVVESSICSINASETAICAGTPFNLSALVNGEFVGTFVNDASGNSYNVTTIGNQNWITKNLETSRYNNGDPIPQITDPVQWQNATYGAWCWYENDSATYSVYGKLYNWHAVNDPRGLAPEGWSVASLANWNELVSACGGSAQAMIALKDTGAFYWSAPPNIPGSNSTGFKALPSGLRVPDGWFGYINWDALWWTSTSINTSNAHYFAMRHAVSTTNVFSYYDNKNYGFSVRCVKSAQQNEPNNYSVLWSTGETTPTITVAPTETTTYNVTVNQGNQTCSSTITINVNQPSATDESVSACNTYTWKGNTYNQSGTYTWTGQNAVGCDSVVTLNLIVYSNPTVTFEPENVVFCNTTESVELSGGLPLGGTYTGAGVFNNEFNPSQVGNGSYPIFYFYTDMNGCTGGDSTIYEVATCTGIDVISNLDFMIYPNPVEDYAMVSISDLDRETEFELVLIDAAGRIVMQKQVLIGNEGYTLFVSDLARGIYSLTLSNAEQHFVKRLVK
jgi:uncharacterized protein (TIGR02145 family)